MNIAFITGASGSGKTTLVRELEQTKNHDYAFYYFDSIGVPNTDAMIEEYGSGDEWQRQATVKWVGKILTDGKRDLAILDGQMRLSFIQDACKEHRFSNYQIILVDCDDEVREQRLVGRGQPELASTDMMNWATYLRKEAYDLEATVLDTSSQSTAESKAALLQLLEAYAQRD